MNNKLMHESVVKLFVKVDEDYLFSIKNAPNDTKHNRLELIGGHLVEGENPYNGLIRETREEETTGLLAQELIRQHPLEKLLKLKYEQIISYHYIYTVSITHSLAIQFRFNPSESLGYKRVPRRIIQRNKDIINILNMFTPKTVMIFKALHLTE